ncbi:chromatin modification-related protein EAF1 B [Capsicum galapagoense]
MHGCSVGSDLVVNAGVDSMGEFVEGGMGIGTKTSPRTTAIEKARAELRQEYGGQHESRRQLEFLEEGGDPLEFKFEDVATLSVQSTSLTDKHPDLFVTSEIKGSFAITTSAHGDSVESSGRPGAPQLCEPNSADNLMLFDGKNKFVGSDRGYRHPSRSNVTPSGQSSKFEESQNAKELGKSAAFGIPKKAYKRRNRSRTNRDSARSSSSDIARGGHDTSLPLQPFPKDVKGPVSDLDKDQNSSLNIAQTPSPNGGMALKTMLSDNQLDLEVDGVKAAESTTDFKKDNMLDTVPDASASRGLLDDQHNQNSLTCVQKTIQEAPEKPQLSLVKERAVSSGLDCQPDTTEREVENSSSLMNGFGSRKDYKKSFANEAENSGAALGAKGLDSESSCTQTSLSLDGLNDSEMCTNRSILDSNGNLNGQLVVPDGMAVTETDVKVKNEIKADMNSGLNNENHNSGHGNHQGNVCVPKSSEELVCTVSNSQSEIKDKLITERMEDVGPSELEITRKCFVLKSEDPDPENVCNVGVQGMINTCIPEHPECVSETRVSNLAPEGQAPRIQGDEDSILKEAQIIEAKHKRIAELSAVSCPLENIRKSHWGYVLEEMVWLANDFAQERLWKITAAGQICHQVAFNSRLRFLERNRRWEQKTVAHDVAKSVMDFWHSIEVYRGKSQKMELASPKKDYTIAIREYAMRFLKYNDSDVPKSQAEAPLTPDRISDWGTMDASSEDHLKEENLFYPVLLGAMDAYRKSIESHVQLCEKTGNGLQEEVETSACDAATGFAYEVDEGETNAYDRSVPLDGNKSSRFPQKTPKIHLKGYTGRPYDVGADILFTENRVGNHQSVLQGKRPASTLDVSIPTKRVRTASRQRVVSPFGATAAGCVQLPIKTDASSGDTGSFQDDQSTLHGGSHMNSLEVESVGDYEKHLLFDSAEVSKPKKKKKAKLLGSAYGQRWQADSNYQANQKDHSRKRFESHQFESNGSSGLFGQHNAKKPKMLRQSFETFENNAPIGGSIPSPVASQMSNMSNPNKFMRMLSGRDRNRKSKTLKMPAGQPGSGSPWSLFEEQALVVLVHDMGPNWELVSDAINSTLQFKCIYRKPNECKERHKVLMDRTTGDGADSAEDSGSSQPYPSTLPGIPKGSARQLFQRLQGPMEEDTLKSHFEKIILIGKKYLLEKTQGENYDLKHIQQPHDSHIHALTQLCPSYLNGGPILTPLDLCEELPPSSPDFLPVGFEGPHSGGLSISSQAGGSSLPASGANSGVQASSNMILGSNFPSSSGPLNASVRYAVPRSAPFPVVEHQRTHQYNQMLSGGNVQSSTSSPGALAGGDNGGARTHPSGNNMGTLSGFNRGMPMARPGFQGMTSSSMLNSGSMLSSGVVAMPSTVNMQSGVSSNQGNSMSRSRDVLHMIRPSQNQEAQRQMTVPELQIKASQGSSQGVHPFGGSSSSFPNQTASSPVSSHPLHHQQPHLLASQQPLVHSPRHPHLQGASHATSPQHQAYAIRLARERHLQQRLLQQQQQLSHTQPHLPISSPLQNSPQITSQTSSPPVSLSPLASPSSMSPMPPHQLKHPFPAHGLGRTAQTGGSMNKQRPPQIGQQQLQNASRHHPPQRQQPESQKQAKVLKGAGRGKSMTHQTLQIDPSLSDGLPTDQMNQSAEKGEQATQLVQGQGILVQPAKQKVNQPQHAHSKIYSGQVPLSKKQQIPSNSDSTNQGLASSGVLGPNLPHQSLPTSVVGSSNHRVLMHPQQQVQLRPKLMTQSQAALQGVLQRKRSLNSEPPNKLQPGEPQSEQHNICNTSQIGKTPVQNSKNLANAAEVSAPGATQMKVAVPSLDSIGTPPTNSAGGDTVPEVSQGLSQMQSSGKFSPTGRDASVQWKQKSSELRPPLLVTQPQSHQQQQQRPPLQHPDQAQVLQAGKRSLLAKPNESRLD